MDDETNRQWTLAARPEGEPTLDDFELVEGEPPDPGPDEALIRTLYLSVDPYMRGRMRAGESYAAPWEPGDVLRAGIVGEVVESNHPDFESGDVVFANRHWAEYATAKGGDLTPVDPDLAPISTALGVLGMPGRTAYFGTLEVADPGPGDTAVISGAAGAVGSVAGQLADLAGARVVGIAGSEEKIEWLTDDLGFDAGINYESEAVSDRLAETCPDGIDVYYDNVGGEITDAVVSRLNVDARVAVCGQIALYNEEETPVGPRKLGKLIETRARIEGFLVGDFESRYERANRRLAEWVNGGELEYEETITEDFESAPEAFIGLFEGENIGKQLVKVGDREP